MQGARLEGRRLAMQPIFRRIAGGTPAVLYVRYVS
jgi:hypothetical protein